MALVTVQRSPSLGSPHCSNSDGEAEDDDGNKNEKSSECFFAGKGTALVLALKDIPHHSERRLSTDSTKSTNSTQSNNSDIQQHLQSMFYLLSHEETLKMAVKLESHRPNRTRYLVIVSRCCFRTSSTERKSNRIRNNSTKLTAALAAVPANTTTATIINTTSTTNSHISLRHSQQQSELSSQMDVSDINMLLQVEKRCTSSSAATTHVAAHFAMSTSLGLTASTAAILCNANRQSFKCDGSEKNTGSGDGKCMEEGIEESCLLGIDCNERTTIGLVVPILANTTIHLDGDGGFSVSVSEKTHIFKPVSVQAMWSALQTLHKVSQKARENNYYLGGPSHDWLSYYESRIESDQSCLNEWNAMDSLESRRPPSPDAIRNKPTAKDETENVIKMKLKEIMMSVDLDEVTSKYIRGRLEEHLDMDLGEYKSFIDEEMLMILGQMDAPTEIFEHVYLGSEWNASNLEELQKNGVRHILNVTREIDNFFPGMFDYFNVRVYDDEKTNLLKHWDNTYRYISRAKAEGSKVLVHCKMGVSRSASVVIAYAMKAYNWEFAKALQHVKERRNCIKPNKNFLTQLETYRGMLDAMKNKEKLQRSKSETNLKSTKDARLLPGSEPTPLIQALNRSKTKSKSAGNSVTATGGEELIHIDCVVSGVEVSSTIVSGHKQRHLVRRSSSTSPKGNVQSHSGLVIKQQSQSLENLTPERSIADEPKNVRFPGSNGENYSVTQNRVLHIQRNTPIPPPPPPPPQPQSKTAIVPPSVRTIVNDLESNQQQEARKTADDRKILNLQFARSVSHQEAQATRMEFFMGEELAHPAPPLSAGCVKTTLHSPGGSPVWTSSAKLITQTSKILTQRNDQRRDTASSDCSDSSSMCAPKTKEDTIKRRSRKTQSWAATTTNNSGNSDSTSSTDKVNIMDSLNAFGAALNVSSNMGSNSSVESASTNASSNAYHSIVRTRSRQRELPSRHASWGSGDNRCGLPMRNSSWSSYDTKRNNFQCGSTTSNAIFEGQIHELNMSDKTVGISSHAQLHPVGTVKRTKQKLEEVTALKKLCQESSGVSDAGLDSSAVEMGGNSEDVTSVSLQQKRSSNLYRSASAATATIPPKSPLRCNSEEFVTSVSISATVQRPIQHVAAMRRSDGNRPLHSELFPASERYVIADDFHANRSALAMEADGETCVMLRKRTQEAEESKAAEDQRISGNVQILKKNFEAKAGATITSTSQVATILTKKAHQSLPSSPVAQHVDHAAVANANVITNVATTTLTGSNITTTSITSASSATFATSTTSSSSYSSSSCSSVSDSCDRNVKGLVHKYQTTSTGSSSTTSSITTSAASTTASGNIMSSSSGNSSSSSFRSRPRSYYENPHYTTQKSLTGKPHEYSESRPPPAPTKLLNANTAHAHTTHTSNTTSMTENILMSQPASIQQAQPQKRLQQHGKTHPLTRLSLSKQSFNAAAYNTM